ncbi:MAG: hypothetical protein AABY22_31505 [Nanoarchaeota archaeon]
MKNEIYGFNNWITEEKEAIKNKCACSVAIKKLREIKNRDDIDLDICSCKSHKQVLGHCIVCGAK